MRSDTDPKGEGRLKKTLGSSDGIFTKGGLFSDSRDPRRGKTRKKIQIRHSLGGLQRTSSKGDRKRFQGPVRRFFRIGATEGEKKTNGGGLKKILVGFCRKHGRGLTGTAGSRVRDRASSQAAAGEKEKGARRSSRGITLRQGQGKGGGGNAGRSVQVDNLSACDSLTIKKEWY